MKLPSTKHPSHKNIHRKTRTHPGFASVLTVISVGIGILVILLSMYDDTVESQNTQKNHMLRSDYQQREEAFLRALTNIVPNKAITCMQPATANDLTLQWNTIFDDALTLSNTNQPLDDTRAQNLLGLGAGQFRTANTAGNNINRASVVLTSNLYSVSGTVEPVGDQVFSGSDIPANNSYPPPLTTRNFNPQNDATFPIVSLDKQYGASTVGWVGADFNSHPHYNLVESPSLHFNYSSADTIIAKHNWWGFGLSMSANDSAATRVNSRAKEYIISLYEIPSQLGINSASFTALGAHADGREWTNFNVRGSAYARRVIATDNFSSDAISSRQGVQLEDNATIGDSITNNQLSADELDAEGDPFATDAREQAQSDGTTFPISSSANGGRVSFFSINRGLEFYDRYSVGNPIIGDTSSSNGASSTSWNYYSIGANQCKMRIDILEVAAADNQLPQTIRFTYATNADATAFSEVIYSKDTNNINFPNAIEWPDPDSSFPFQPLFSVRQKPSLLLFADRLQQHLRDSLNADFPQANNSISINPDYVNNPEIQQPSFPASDTDTRLILSGSRDLTSFTGGFSIVTNLRLIIEDDTNIVPFNTVPAELQNFVNLNEHMPATSFFAPETRYGNSLEAVQIELGGQITSLAQGGNQPTRIGDLKSGQNDEVDADAISADLTSIDHPSLLPPINTFNWMVVVRELHQARR